MKKTTSLFKLTCLFLFLLTGNIVHAQNDKTPMMGWSSWNTFRINISEDLIKETADAMVSKGLKTAGYTFVNVDDGFFGGRDTDGKLLVHPTRFPNGMDVVSDYIHSKGLKAGIYSEAGKNTCGSQYDSDINGINAGFYGYEEQDADMYFDEWNYDFIKIDYCGAASQGLDEKTQYTKIWNAIQNTEKVKNGGNIRWNICRWMFPGTWATEIAGSWRISHDIRNNFDSDLGIRDVLEHNLYLSAYASPGHFNDMDMMQIGRGNFSEDEEKSHFGLWCIMNSPLMIGCDLRSIPQSTLAIITNTEVIALNQDVLGLQAQVVKRNGKQFVLAKQIEQDQGKIRAVALFNGESSAKTMRITFKDIQLGGTVTVRDLWNKTNVGQFADYYEVSVPAHGTAMLRLEGTSSFDQVKYEGEDAFMNLYKADGLQKSNEARFEEKSGASGGFIMTKLGNSADNWAEFRRVYSTTGGTYKLKIYYYSPESRSLKIKINNTEHELNNLKSGSARGTVYLENITLQEGYNTIRFGNSNALAPDIDKFYVLTPDAVEEPEEYEPDTDIINNYKFPQISSEDTSSETWYYIQFKNPVSGPRGVLADQGDDVNVKTEAKMFYKDEQLWKITGDADDYSIVNKNGRKLSFANGRFQTSSTNAVKVKILATENTDHAPAWEIQREGSSQYMNQNGGAGVDKEIAEYGKGDQGNMLLFVASDKETNLMPELSTNNHEVWYYIKFKNGGNVLQDMGIDEDLRIQQADKNVDEQLWKITGTKDNYIISNKSGRVISYADGYYKATSKNAQPFKFIYTANQDWVPAWELQRPGETGKCLNQYQNTNPGQPISEWSVGDGGNMLNFFLPEEMGFSENIEEFPEISSDENSIWYHIQFKNGNGVLQDMGNNQNILTKAMEKNADQHWKVVKVSNTAPFIYQIENKSGRRIAHVSSVETSDGLYQTTDVATSATNFNIVKSTNASYPTAWELHREGSGRHMNQYKATGIDRLISEWNKGDQGNPLVFVRTSPTTSLSKTREENKIPFIISDKTLRIIEPNIVKATLFTASGQVLDTKTHSFIFSFPASGCYLISMQYIDGQLKTYPCISN